MNAPSEIAHGAISVGLLSSFMNSPDRDLLAPGPRNPSHKGDFAIAGDLIYFSFVTLTTTGYGDIAPLHPYARGLANIEAIIGQIYP